MSLQTQLNSFVLRVAQEFNAVKSRTGNLADLQTLNKANLVAAINEVLASVSGAAVIDDLQIGTGTTYSSSKIASLLDGLKAEILGGADAAYDTLLELQQAIQSDQAGLADILAALDKRVRYDAPQTLTSAEQAQARANIGAVASTDIGDFNLDLVAIFEAALV